MTTLSWIALSIGAVAGWAIAVAYAYRRYPNFGCRTCGGNGRKYEPFLLALLCFRISRRAWGKCHGCSGAANYEKRWWLSR